jgi:hypothetical protein
MQGKASDDNASRQTSIRKKLYHWINYSMEAHDDNIKKKYIYIYIVAKHKQLRRCQISFMFIGRSGIVQHDVNKKQVELRTLMICK